MTHGTNVGQTVTGPGNSPGCSLNLGVTLSKSGLLCEPHIPSFKAEDWPPGSASSLGTASGPLRSASPPGTHSGPPLSASLLGTDSGPPQCCGALPALVPAGPSARSIILHFHGPAGSWALKFQLKCHRGALPTHLSHAGATAVTPLPGLLLCTCHHSEKKLYICMCVC